ncbi:hypothetical protein VNO80_22950 [Phaseolus coccineus]|uniref:Uncharacterized protein n=1 Tax=Phaseolus coccineus TaxID=3886 RepID=A0AAN9QS73_PHACN
MSANMHIHIVDANPNQNPSIKVRCHMYMHSRTFFGANNVVPQLKDATWDISQTMSRMKSTKLLDEQNAKLKSTMLCTVATYH